MKKFYRIYVEGGFHDETKSKARAKALADKFEAEGWNVQILEMTETIFGPMGVRVWL